MWLEKRSIYVAKKLSIRDEANGWELVGNFKANV